MSGRARDGRLVHFAPGASDVRPGDVVEISFAAWMKPGERGWELRSIKKLPADTELRFGPATPK